jgi:hypothetical protein
MTSEPYNLDGMQYADKEAKRQYYAYVSLSTPHPDVGYFEMDDRGLWFRDERLVRPERLSEPFMIRSDPKGLWLQFTTIDGIAHELLFNPKQYIGSKAGAKVKKILRGFEMELSKKEQVGNWILGYLTAAHDVMWKRTIWDVNFVDSSEESEEAPNVD